MRTRALGLMVRRRRRAQRPARKHRVRGGASSSSGGRREGGGEHGCGAVGRGSGGGGRGAMTLALAVVGCNVTQDVLQQPVDLRRCGISDVSLGPPPLSDRKETINNTS